MKREHAMNGWTKAAVATSLLLFLLANSGCTFPGKRTLAGASALSFVPFRSATKPVNPMPYQVESCFYGYHGTSWRAWPACDSCEPVGEWLEELPAPAPESAPESYPAAGRPEMSWMR